ncbi:MAG: hypothetical protein Q8O92_12865 [Candidatus Latescibacter sp.]|nr:hypothetical protein [Candidatus Latescibacter sp.]
MKAIINFLNLLTDTDWFWSPLLRFRPPKDKNIGSIVVLKITPFIGTVAGIIFAAIQHHLQSPTHFIVDVMFGWVAFFIIYRITFAPAWNSRARMLRQNRAEQGASPDR